MFTIDMEQYLRQRANTSLNISLDARDEDLWHASY